MWPEDLEPLSEAVWAEGVGLALAHYASKFLSQSAVAHVGDLEVDCIHAITLPVLTLVLSREPAASSELHELGHDGQEVLVPCVCD